MKILLFGSTGQVGKLLVPPLQQLGDLTALQHEDADFEGIEAVLRVLELTRPDIIVNAAAYTAVDKAESERQQAFAINARAPSIIANWVRTIGARLIHYSSDYVYDGEGSSFRAENQGLGPVNYYGESKLAGDKAIEESGAQAIILRSSWIYGGVGAGFLSTILERAESGEELRVVNDQFGAPTSAGWLAKITIMILQRWLATSENLGIRETRVFHTVPAGATSWMGFAAALLEEAGRLGLPISNSSVTGIPTVDWPTLARRPQNSRLDAGLLERTFGIIGPNWRDLVRAEVESYASLHDTDLLE